MNVAFFSNGYGQRLRLLRDPRVGFLSVGLLAEGQTSALVLGGCHADEEVTVLDYSIGVPGATFTVAKHCLQPLVEWMRDQGVQVEDDRTSKVPA